MRRLGIVLDVTHLTELRDRLRELADDPEVRVVVLTGAGEKAFIAGADIKYMSGLGVEEAGAWGALGHECGRLLETMHRETALKWLAGFNAHLRNRRPIDVIAQGRITEVIDAIEAEETGAYA